MEENISFHLHNHRSNDKDRRSDEKPQFVYTLHGTIFQNMQHIHHMPTQAECMRTKLTRIL